MLSKNIWVLAGRFRYYGDRETFGYTSCQGFTNYETLYAQGLDAVETHVLSPEEGYILSEMNLFLTVSISPLVSDIIVPLEALKIARKIVELSGLAV